LLLRIATSAIFVLDIGEVRKLQLEFFEELILWLERNCQVDVLGRRLSVAIVEESDGVQAKRLAIS